MTNRERPHIKRLTHTLLALTRGTEHGCGLAPDGRAYCWGSNRLGQLGDDGASGRSSVEEPVRVSTEQTFVGISAGANHTCAWTREGVVYCWGLNLTGELGQAVVANDCDGFACNRRPVRLETSVRFDTVSAGFGHTCGLSGGRAFCWGRNDRGQLGDARADDVCEGAICNVTPIAAGGGERFTTIAAGGDHTCGIANGVAFCWGSNQYGQLGADRSVASSARPIALATTGRVVSIEARGIRTCVTMDNRRRTCWGGTP